MPRDPVRQLRRNLSIALQSVYTERSFAVSTALGMALALTLIASTLSLTTLGLEAAMARVAASGFDVLHASLSAPQGLSRIPWSAGALREILQAVHGSSQIDAFSVADVPVQDGVRTRSTQVLSNDSDGSAREPISMSGPMPGALPLSLSVLNMTCLVDSDQRVKGSPRTLLPSGLRFKPVGEFSVSPALLLALTPDRPAMWISGEAFDAVQPGNPRHFVQIHLQTTQYAEVAAAMAQARAYFDRRYPTMDAHLSTPWDSLQGEKDLFDTLRRLATLGAGVIAVLAALAMSGAIMASLRQRRLEIGTRLAIGALPSDIALQVMLEIVALASLGTVIGSGVTLAATYLWCAWTGWQWQPVPGAMVYAAGGIFLPAMAASIWPAVTAARTDPVRVLV